MSRSSSTAPDRRRRWTGSRKVAGALSLGVGVAGATLWAIQHRSVAKALSSAGEFESEGLVLPPGLSHRHVEVDDGARLKVVESGVGPPILLVHGFMLDSSIWACQFRDLAGSRRVVALDLRGHGGSDIGAGFDVAGEESSDLPRSLRRVGRMARKGVGAPGIRRLALDLKQVIESLDLRDATLVGHSMGGMVALQLAQDEPALIQERFNGIVLASTLAGPFMHTPGFGWMAGVAGPACARAVLLADQLGVRTVPSNDLRYWLSRMGFGADATASQVRLVEGLLLETPPETVAALLPSLAAFDLSAGLPDIEAHVLVTVGSYDHLTPPRYGRRMAGALRSAELVELARCGHMPMIERPHEFSHLLEEFSAKTGRL